MKIEDAAALQAAYDEMVKFVVARIYERAGGFGLSPQPGDDDESYKVAISDGAVTLSYFENGYYDSGDFYTSTVYPAWLIFQDGEEFAASLRAHNARVEREEQERSAAYQASREREERAEYEALKRKYG